MHIYCIVAIQGHVFHFVSVLPPPSSHARINKMHAFVLILFFWVCDTRWIPPTACIWFCTFQRESWQCCSFLLDAAGGAPRPHFPSLPPTFCFPHLHLQVPSPSTPTTLPHVPRPAPVASAPCCLLYSALVSPTLRLVWTSPGASVFKASLLTVSPVDAVSQFISSRLLFKSPFHSDVFWSPFKPHLLPPPNFTPSCLRSQPKNMTDILSTEYCHLPCWNGSSLCCPSVTFLKGLC